MINKQKFNSSTNQKPPSKDAVLALAFGSIPQDDQLDWLDFKLIPTPIKTILRIGKELMEWAVNDPNALKVRQFFRSRGIDYDTIGRWRKRCSEFDRMYRFALDAIGDRREMAAFHKKASETIVMGTMVHYDPDYKEFIEWKQKMTQYDTDNKPQIIVLDKIPDSSLVPEKETDAAL